MLWIVYSLACALAEALKDVASRKALNSCSRLTMATAVPLFSIPIFIWVSIESKSAIPSFDDLWQAAPLLFLDSALHIVAMFLYMDALAAAPLAQTLPLVSLTPLFMLVTSPLINREYASSGGALGVVMIVAGAYIANIRSELSGLTAPILALATNPGSRSMLGVAFIWAITGNLDRVGMQYVSLPVWLLLLLVIMSICLCGLLYGKGLLGEIYSRNHFIPLFLAGIFGALSLFLYMKGIELANISYVVAVKRTSILMGILLGFIYLRERPRKLQLVGAFVMVAGVFVFALLRD